MYTDDEMLSLSGIQHYTFCPRQWALIHLEQLWEDNKLTAEGNVLHSNVDNPFKRETNGNGIITLRRIRIASQTLGLTGIVDAIEIIPLAGSLKDKRSLLKSKSFEALPVEYKRGKSKVNDCDRLQVVAQAMILEEMLGVRIDRVAIFYWEVRHRENVEVTPAIREKVVEVSTEMHRLFYNQEIPRPIYKAGCKSCSLKNLCLPKIVSRGVKQYLQTNFDETSS